MLLYNSHRRGVRFTHLPLHGVFMTATYIRMTRQARPRLLDADLHCHCQRERHKARSRFGLHQPPPLPLVSSGSRVPGLPDACPCRWNTQNPCLHHDSPNPNACRSFCSPCRRFNSLRVLNPSTIMFICAHAHVDLRMTVGLGPLFPVPSASGR